VARILRSLERRESSGTGTSNNFPSVADEFPVSKVETKSNASAPAAKVPVAEEDDLPF